MRYKRKNMHLIGIIHEPKDVNNFRQPLVADLKDFWHGVTLTVLSGVSGSEQALVRCALLCVEYDIPASRKVCVFCPILLLWDVPNAAKYFLEE